MKPCSAADTLGKTIKDISLNTGEVTMITFTDNTFLLIQAFNGQNGDGPEIGPLYADQAEVYLNNNLYVAEWLGLITKEERNRRATAKREEQEKHFAEMRRAQYETLKKEFESNPGENK